MLSFTLFTVLVLAIVAAIAVAVAVAVAVAYSAIWYLNVIKRFYYCNGPVTTIAGKLYSVKV